MHPEHLQDLNEFAFGKDRRARYHRASGQPTYR
jgi:hypothetical protein